MKENKTKKKQQQKKNKKKQKKNSRSCNFTRMFLCEPLWKLFKLCQFVKKIATKVQSQFFLYVYNKSFNTLLVTGQQDILKKMTAMEKGGGEPVFTVLI